MIYNISNNMKRYIFLVTPFFIIVSGTNGLEQTKKNESYVRMQELEVPDSALLLNNYFRLRKLPAALSRQNQDNSEQSSVSRPCSCSLGVCKCCSGPILDFFKQKACMKIAYNPGDFAFDVAMSMNDRILYENSMSGKNPRPICISPPRMPNLKVCARFYNVFFPGRNFHFCMSMRGEWRSFELFNLVFDCLRMGANGLVMVKPDDGGGLPVPNPQGGVDAVIDAGEDDIEEYDENLVRSLMDILGD